MSSEPIKIPLHGHVRVIAPSSSPNEWSKLELAVQAFEALGFTVSLGKNIRKKKGYLAGTDAQRLADLHDAFRDKTVDAIFSLRGGYGTPRLLNKIDYPLIKKNPKPFIGYSDVTALQLALLSKANIGSYSGPDFLKFIKDGIMSELSIAGLLRAAVKQEKKIDLFAVHKRYLSEVKVLRSGAARGKLIGGNLSLFCSLLGTEYFPNLKGAILFLEDINESSYRFDRLLTQLILSKQLSGVVGIFFGQNRECPNAEEIIQERLGSLKVPLAIGIPYGHIQEFITIPIGARATLTLGKKISLTI